MKISKKDLDKVEIEQTKTGFIVWVTEIVKGKPVKHWLIDASVILTKGRMNISEDDCGCGYKYLINYDTVNSQLKIVKE